MLLLSLVLALDLRLELVRQSLTGTHYRYRQYIEGEAVVGGVVEVTVRSDGTTERIEACGFPSVAAPASGAVGGRERPPLHRIVNVNGVLHRAREERIQDGPLRTVRYIDLETNAVLREERLFANAKPARVFDPNPIAALNDPTLQDQNNSSSAVPPQAYKTVELDANASGPLGGPFVQIVDVQNPAVAPVDGSSSLTLDRGQSGFEDVNAYFHIDQSQRYLQSLGYSGGRAIAAYAVEVDTHAANGSDNSFFISTSPGRGTLFFGDGGTDDAEDSDLVVHEYAHVIHDFISPGTFLTSFNSQARAVSEGFGDYWAFSQTYDKTIASGRDPYCFADWDARCANDAPEEQCSYSPGADCLRRLDSAKTMADFIDTDTTGTEHRNGEIWSSALREIFHAIGKRTTDTIVIESFFGAPPNPSFASMARRMIAVDRILSGGANANVVCAAMTKRGILSDCLTVPRGELTFFQGPQRGIAIPDNDPNGVTLRTTVSDPRSIDRLYVNVNIAHQSRGDLRIVLAAPDGTEVVLQEGSLDRARDVNAIYGRDTIPAQSLDVFRGRSAAGEWKLRVSDVRPGDRGSVSSWSLVIQFAGDIPLTTRPSGQPRQVIAAAAHTPGAHGTYFITDLRLFNRQSRDLTVTLVFGRSASDFASIRVVVPRGHVIALDDVVGVAMQAAGGGQLEIQGDVIATSRTYTRTSRGTFGQFIPAVPVDAALVGGDIAAIPFLTNNASFRANIGFANVGGEPATVIFPWLTGAPQSYTIEPFGHLQVPAMSRGDELPAEFSIQSGRVLAYASVIDNRTGDPFYVPAQRHFVEGEFVSAPVISSPGALGTYWRSDVVIALLGDIGGPSRVTFIDAATGEREERNFTGLVRDVLPTMFQHGGLGVLTIDLHSGFAMSRIWTGDANGTFGQFVPFTANASIEAVDLLHVENSAAFRTNLGVYSPEPSRVRVTIYDSAGNALEHHELALEPWRLVQFPVSASVVNGRAGVEVLSGRVIAYASMIDNATGDPIFVPAQ